MREYTDPDGFTLRVFSSLYVDWGLEITKDGETIFYSPHALSAESYGFKPPDDYDGEWDKYEGEWKRWTDEEWVECLKREADELIEAFCYEYISKE